jgi:hypothetical protein
VVQEALPFASVVAMQSRLPSGAVKLISRPCNGADPSVRDSFAVKVSGPSSGTLRLVVSVVAEVPAAISRLP